MRTIQATTGMTIPIGRQGENLATEVVFKMPNLVETYGPGSAKIFVQNPHKDTYVVEAPVVDGLAHWVIRDVDLAYVGYGMAELHWLGSDGETIAKPSRYGLRINDALGYAGEIPDPIIAWLDEVGQRIDEQIEKITEGADSTKSYADQAAASAQSAARDAQTATSQAGLVGGMLREANTILQAVKGLSTEAADSKSAAEDAETAAKAARDEAVSSMQAAQSSETYAGIAANAAITARTAASSAASEAATSAASAATSAERAEAARAEVEARLPYKTEKKLLQYDGTDIRLNGVRQTYAMIYDYCMVSPDFVVLVYEDRAYHVNTVSGSQIVFISSYVSNGYEQMNRITITSHDAVALTMGKAEMLANKTDAITELNKADANKYPSVKAVANYAAKKTDLEDAKSSLSESIAEVEKKVYNAQTVIENHIHATPDYGTYTVRFPKWETSHTSNGEKLDDNQGLVLTPATDTIKEVNTYPHCFDTLDVNAYIDDDGVRHITAIKGDANFRDTGRVDVFVCLRTYWEKYWEENGYEYYSRCYYPKEGYTVVSLAKNKDGSISPWFLIAKYMAGDILDDDSTHTHELYSSKGLKPAHYISSAVGEEEINDSISWSGMQSIFRRRGKYYTGSLLAEQKHFTTSMWLYFATKNSQSIMYGYENSSVQYICAEPLANTNKFVITASQANNIDLLQCVTIGGNGSTTAPDRNIGACHNIAYDVRVIGKETLPSGNVAIVVDHAPFTTTATSWISSFHEVSGYSDYILGRNGSPVSNSNGRHGMVLDGIELMVGGYETVGNAIFNATADPLVRDIVLTNDATKLSTNASTFIANATTLSEKARVTTAGAWNYITEVALDLENGAIINSQSGSSGSGSSFGHADGQYFDSITSGQREVLCLGFLGNGSSAGLRFVSGSTGVSNAAWSILARLSVNACWG